MSLDLTTAAKTKRTLAGALKVAERHGGSCLSLTYVGEAAPLSWLCAAGHEWSASARTVDAPAPFCHACATGKYAPLDLRRASKALAGTLVDLYQILPPELFRLVGDYLDAALWQLWAYCDWPKTAFYHEMQSDDFLGVVRCAATLRDTEPLRVVLRRSLRVADVMQKIKVFEVLKTCSPAAVEVAAEEWISPDTEQFSAECECHQAWTTELGSPFCARCEKYAQSRTRRLA